ncbi:uncharacterized protein CIMG_08473 [Coccidioides immitis RS]|uniref:Calcium-dependent cell adhesion molecule 1 membrane-binding domain-containing protein n=3 Tax=Coccidioides immitis TaxID=5501 RepID=J3K5K2_COCIM|nr:uncharacterized protein CIMG_08473 [Coccidioides immitis RS]EAS29727.3 hypothetical protein CIMG_08473 [Coccidioides immitis RS]KMP06739.1 hypothetical protein CIRG_06420 [Coccidioides immitis RMSCC 2394]KMU90477.1 hypothetical protein CIHG_08366 [Coccidioides immitis H538.4]TPX22367.1 hypothetical protein DIZ76_014238 [Coccidioides immitis]
MVAVNTVEFYPEKDYGGAAVASELNKVEHLALGTKYLSYHLGSGTKLLVWNHSNYYDQEQWVSDKSSLPAGKQCYKVLAGATRVIGFRFKDATGGAQKAYSLTLNIHDIGQVTLYSNESDQFAIAGTMPQDGPPVTTAVYVRDMRTGIYIVQGSIYFKWDSDRQKVVIADELNWPKQLKHEEDGNDDFTITLISKDP